MFCCGKYPDRRILALLPVFFLLDKLPLLLGFKGFDIALQSAIIGEPKDFHLVLEPS